MPKIAALIALLLPICVIAQDSQKTGASDRAEAMCGVKTYYDGLTLAFQNAVTADGETLVTLQVLPSFQREYAVTVKRTSSAISLYRTDFQKGIN